LLTRRALAASRLVIFDRYYYDILIDPVRYRLPNSCIGFARRLVPLAPAPDLCVLLDVPAEALQHRKQEVSFAESQRQRFAYREMFRSLPNTLLVNADCPLAEVTHQVSTAVLSFAGNVSRRQPEVLRIANP
jgi:thymidylate kinase